MFRDKKVVGAMSAHNVEKTLLQTYSEGLAQDCVDLIIIVDDVSHDRTIEVARGLSKRRYMPTRITGAMAAIRRPATGTHCWREQASSSWSIPITGTPQNSFPFLFQ